MGVRLPSYRLYRFDGAGKIIAAEWIDAADDDAALRQAKSLGSAGQNELWDRERLVSRFRGHDPRSTS